MKNVRFLICAGLILAGALVAFAPCLSNGFVNSDDNEYVTENSLVQDGSVGGLKRLVSSFALGNYQPLTMLSYWVEYRFFGLRPFGYHLTNLILHLGNCLLVWWFLWALTKDLPVACVCALLFGIHPLHVETVAWVSERRNLLYTLFFLSSAICYCRYLSRGQKRGYYYGTLLLFVLSLSAKAQAVMLPFVLMLVEYYVGVPLTRQLLKNKLPFLFFSVLFVSLTVFAHHAIGGIRHEAGADIAARLAIAGSCVTFYLGKVFAPLNLSCLYPYEGLKPLSSYAYPVIICVVLCAGTVLSARYTRKIAFGFFFFLLTLLPVLQFIPIASTVVADHYMYLSTLGVLYLIAAAVCWAARRKGRIGFFLKIAGAVFLIGAGVGGIMLARQRCTVWKDSVALWSDVLQKYPRAATAYNNRGAEFLARKDYGRAYADFTAALAIDPGFFEAHFNIASLLAESGKDGEAIARAHTVLKINPGHRRAYELLMNVYGRKKDHEAMIRVCTALLEREPRNGTAFNNLCSAYGSRGEYEKAIECGKAAVALNPRSVSAHRNLATAYYYAKQYEAAQKHSQRARELAGQGRAP